MSSSKSNKSKKPGPSPSSAVTVPITLPSARAGEHTDTYWLGTMPHSPIQNVTAGGQTFPRFRGTPVFDLPGGGSSTPLVMGIEVELTQDQVELVKHAIQVRVVRITEGASDFAKGENVPEFNTNTRRKDRRARVYMADSAKYRPSPADVPMATLVYMHRLADFNAKEIRNFPPASMAGEVVDDLNIKPNKVEDVPVPAQE